MASCRAFQNDKAALKINFELFCCKIKINGFKVFVLLLKNQTVHLVGCISLNTPDFTIATQLTVF